MTVSGQNLVTLSADLPKAETWRFADRSHPFGRRGEKDHIALYDADKTFCGRSVNPTGYPVGDSFDPSATYACKRCAAVLRKRGPVLCRSVLSYSDGPRFVEVAG
jgi:hypothetical protein